MKKIILLLMGFITLGAAAATGIDALTAIANLHQIDKSKIRALGN